MKKLMTLLASAVLVLTGPGCSTLGIGNGNTQSETQQLASLARVAAFTGAATYLQSHPEDTDKFEMAYKAVDSLLLSDTIDPLALREALSMLPSDELRGDKSAIIISAAMLLFEGLNGGVTPVDTPPEVKAFAVAIRDGLALALGGTGGS